MKILSTFVFLPAVLAAQDALKFTIQTDNQPEFRISLVAPRIGQEPDLSDELIKVLIAQESNGNDYAIGDGGYAYGCLQIHPKVVEDVNKIASTRYSHSDAFNRTKAIEICRIYLRYYASFGMLGRKATFEDICRIWNGGPEGYLKWRTVKYWNGVSKRLEPRAVSFVLDTYPVRTFYFNPSPIRFQL